MRDVGELFFRGTPTYSPSWGIHKGKLNESVVEKLAVL